MRELGSLRVKPLAKSHIRKKTLVEDFENRPKDICAGFPVWGASQTQAGWEQDAGRPEVVSIMQFSVQTQTQNVTYAGTRTRESKLVLMNHLF